jgi:hypothetical protein
MPARVRLYFPLKTCLLLSLILGLAQNPCDLAGDSGKETFTVFLMVFVLPQFSPVKLLCFGKL